MAHRLCSPHSHTAALPGLKTVGVNLGHADYATAFRAVDLNKNGQLTLDELTLMLDPDAKVRAPTPRRGNAKGCIVEAKIVAARNARLAEDAAHTSAQRQADEWRELEKTPEKMLEWLRKELRTQRVKSEALVLSMDSNRSGTIGLRCGMDGLLWPMAPRLPRFAFYKPCVAVAVRLCRHIVRATHAALGRTTRDLLARTTRPPPAAHRACAAHAPRRRQRVRVGAEESGSGD